MFLPLRLATLASLIAEVFAGVKNNTYICMPEVFRLFGFTYFFFSREHKPIHVHIEGAEGYAVYELGGTIS